MLLVISYKSGRSDQVDKFTPYLYGGRVATALYVIRVAVFIK
jgi:hypothetical protein